MESSLAILRVAAIAAALTASFAAQSVSHAGDNVAAFSPPPAAKPGSRAQQVRLVAPMTVEAPKETMPTQVDLVTGDGQQGDLPRASAAQASK
jgi:hypothetical protein